jgi:hypothetical protein
LALDYSCFSLLIYPDHQEDLQEAKTAEFCGQTSRTLRTNTARKKRQRKVIEAKNKKISRLNKKLSKVIRNKKTQESALDDALKKLPPHLAGFVKLQFDLHAAKKHGRRYSPDMKSLAISLFHASGKAYRLLSKLLSCQHDLPFGTTSVRCQQGLVYHRQQSTP